MQIENHINSKARLKTRFKGPAIRRKKTKFTYGRVPCKMQCGVP
jgi:hypothetical protein